MKVYLGGTWIHSNWRSCLKPLLHIDYFDPIDSKWNNRPNVPNWNIEVMKEEIKQKEECDIVLYVITPEHEGVYSSIAEAVDDSNKRPEKLIFVPLREWSGRMFNDDAWVSICGVSDLIKRNKVKVSFSLEDAALALNSWERL